MNKISRNKNVPKIMILCYIMTVQEPICVILTDDVRRFKCTYNAVQFYMRSFKENKNERMVLYSTDFSCCRNDDTLFDGSFTVTARCTRSDLYSIKVYN